MRTTLAALTVTALLPLGLTAPVAPGATAAAPAPAGVEQQAPPRADRAAMRRKVLQLTNKRRVDRGCDPVRWHRRLAVAAQRHTKRMANADTLSHQLPGEPDPGARIRNAGYDWTAWGENIAAGFRTPRSVVRAWMNSPGHRRNILNCDFEHLGVGLASADDGTRYWTQDFGRN